MRATSKARISVNEQVAEESHKPVTKKIQNKKSLCKILRHLTEMESLSFKNKDVKHLSVMDVFTNICLG